MTDETQTTVTEVPASVEQTAQPVPTVVDTPAPQTEAPAPSEQAPVASKPPAAEDPAPQEDAQTATAEDPDGLFEEALAETPDDMPPQNRPAPQGPKEHPRIAALYKAGLLHRA